MRLVHTMILAPLLLLACAAESPESPLAELGRTVVPTGTDEIAVSNEARGPLGVQEIDAMEELKVRLPADYIPSQAVSTNLDVDENDEQIIVFKRRDDSEDLIRILVVTFDAVRNAWIRSWEGVTAATSVRSFSVYTDDLTGDLEQEIVAVGINSDGEQTVDVFKRTSDLLGLGLSYVPILSASADVTIEIEEVPRSEAYDAMETLSAPSFPVVVERRDPDSENIFDSIRTTYFWDTSTRTYRPGRTERVSGQVIEDSRLRDLFAGDEQDFEAYLAGPWYRTSGADDIRLVSFGTRDRTIVFHSGYLQQAFFWLRSTKTVYGRGITLFLQNESIRSVQPYASVAVNDLNEITISVQGSDRWDGTYERLGGSLQSDLVAGPEGFRLSEIQLAGLYRGEDGRELLFASPEFVHRADSHVARGGYALFEVGDETILTLKEIDENRLPVEVSTFRVTYVESASEDRIVRQLELEPGAIGISGFFATEQDSFAVQQIQVLDQDAGTG